MCNSRKPEVFAMLWMISCPPKTLGQGDRWASHFALPYLPSGTFNSLRLKLARLYRVGAQR